MVRIRRPTIALQRSMRVSSSKITFFCQSAAEHAGPRVGPERAAEAVEAVRSDRVTSHATAKTPDIFVGSLQKHVSGSASKPDRVGPGTVLRRYLMTTERLGSFTQRAS